MNTGNMHEHMNTCSDLGLVDSQREIRREEWSRRKRRDERNQVEGREEKRLFGREEKRLFGREETGTLAATDCPSIIVCHTTHTRRNQHCQSQPSPTLSPTGPVPRAY